MEKYKKHIAGATNVEFIHVSLDKDKDSAQKWAVKESFPWLTVMPEKVERCGMDAYRSTGAVPEYHLIDGNGKTVVKGSSSGAAAFAKIAEVAQLATESE